MSVLSIGQKKNSYPGHNMQIDWNHPMAAGLVGFSYRQSTLDAGSKPNLSLGNALRQSSLNPSNGWTFVCNIKRTTSTAWSSALSMGGYVSVSNRVGMTLQYYDTSANLTVLFGQDIAGASMIWTTPGEAHIAVSYSGGSTIAVWKNGVKEADLSIIAGMNTISRIVAPLGQTSMYQVRTTFTGEGTVYGALYSRDIGAKGIGMLYSDPYCMLRR